MMIRAGLYAAGSDPQIDAAVAVQPSLEEFLALRSNSADASFVALRKALASGRQGQVEKARDPAVQAG